jgi:hypothetical protein
MAHQLIKANAPPELNYHLKANTIDTLLSRKIASFLIFRGHVLLSLYHHPIAQMLHAG